MKNSSHLQHYTFIFLLSHAYISFLFIKAFLRLPDCLNINVHMALTYSRVIQLYMFLTQVNLNNNLTIK